MRQPWSDVDRENRGGARPECRLFAPGRGLFLSGTIVGLVGVAAIAVSYIVGFSNVGDPHNQSIAVLSTSLGGAMLCNVATTMYAKDGSNLQKAWKSLTTF